MEEYLDALRMQVCRHCIDARDDGRCTLPVERPCPVERFHAKVVRSVLMTTSDLYSDYVSALRRDVCSRCDYGDAASCIDREHLDCALDRYLPIVIDTIEETAAAT